MANRRVLVIGGGIAGPALALFLKRAGIAATVFEAYAAPTEIGGALGLAPNGMAVLGELGLADAVEREGSVCSTFLFRSPSGRRLGMLPFGPPGRYSRPAVALSRARLHEIVVGAAKKAGIDVVYGKRLSSFRHTPAGVVARFADGSEAEGDLVVGADGIHSRVRACLLPQGPAPAFTGLIGPGGFVPAAAVPAAGADRAAMVFYLGDGAFFGYGFGDSHGARGAFWWTALERKRALSDEERAAVTLAEVRGEILAAAPRWDPAVARLIDATSEFIPPLNLFDVATLPTWHGDRVVLVGDAAHAVSPHSGQGASVALEDALCLARQLRDRDDVAAAVVAFERERRARAEKIVAYGRRSGDTKKKRNPAAAWLQRRLMPVFLRLAANSLDWMYAYRARWPEPAPPMR